MENLIYFLMGVIVGFILGMFRAHKWWLAYNSEYERYSDPEDDNSGATRPEREL